MILKVDAESTEDSNSTYLATNVLCWKFQMPTTPLTVEAARKFPSGENAITENS
jgi:hypothetical protein